MTLERFEMSNNYWEDVYQSKDTDQVSWYQAQDTKTLELIQSQALPQDAKIIDVGSGSSLLIDQLVEVGYKNLYVLDLSKTALAHIEARLKEKNLDTSHIQWLVEDVGQVQLPTKFFDLWHDRAVFHFMVSEEQQQSYLKNLRSSLKPNGLAIISTFAADGPEKCSGLPVERYSIEKLQNTLGPDFKLLQHDHKVHITPWNSEQNFLHSLWSFQP